VKDKYSQLPLANLIRFMLTVTAVLWGVKDGRADLGSFIGFLMIAMHFRTSDHLLAEYKTVATALFVGAVWEYGLIVTHTIHYSGESTWSPVPSWILVFWAMFGTTLNGAFRWFKNHLVLSGFLSAVLAPALGFSAAQLGILDTPKFPEGYLILGTGWAFLSPVLFRMSRYFFETSERIDHR
jgi:phosphate/sulfate permease